MWTWPPTTPAATEPPYSCGAASRTRSTSTGTTARTTPSPRWGVGGQKWVQQADGSLLNPQSGRCLDSPSGATANGTRLQIWDCNGSGAQSFGLS
ncbi:RICIN domain-containing protein [Streptomyces sp.]|uniref:RICIN domain-containing protein n=1 Tax=Streptomyces sp. TaxID=1931 RepID=UPI0025E18749|nr:RICIN domain-containing protein [Streptomyces sp.]